jgi:Tol biopolymer transport system component
LWTVSVRDGRLTEIAQGNYFNPVYAKDGHHIYLSTEFALWRASLDAPHETKGLPDHVKLLDSLPETSRYLAISADGRKIAFSRMTSSSNIYSLPMSGDHPRGEPEPLTRDTRLRKTNPAVSFDGRHVLFEVGSIDRNGGVWVMDADGRNARPALTPCDKPRWLPGDEDFLCTEYVPDKGANCGQAECWTANVVKVHLATGKEETVLRTGQDGSFFSYSRDGEQVAFMSVKNGPPNTYVASVDDGPPRQVTFDRLSMGFPAWSPDGKVLAVEQKVGDSTHIWLVSPGEPPLELTHDSGQNWPASFSPDGDKIAFAAQRKGVWNLWWVSRRDGSEKQLTFYRSSGEYVRYPDWSPDGRSMAYEYAEITGNIWLLELK